MNLSSKWLGLLMFAGFAAYASDQALSLCPLAFAKAGRFHEATALREHLSTLDSDLGAVSTASKIRTVQGAFLNFRSYGRAFYSDFVHAIDGEPQTQKIKTFVGNILGDAHPENFGIRRFDQGSSHFGAVDLDDIARAPLYYDPLRFLTSAKLADSDADLKAISKAYREGLQGADDAKLGKAVRELIKVSDDTSLKPDRTFYKDGQFFRKDAARDLDAAAKASAQTMLNSVLGSDLKVVDGYIRVTKTGGSTGVERTVVLTEMPKDSPLRKTFNGDHIVYELKPMRKSIAAFAGDADHFQSLSPADMNQVANKIAEGSAAPVTKFVTWNGRPYILRARLRSDETVFLGDVKKAHLQDLLEDEARELGSFQRRANPQVPIADYLNEYAKIESDLVKTADTAASQFEAMDKTLHP